MTAMMSLLNKVGENIITKELNKSGIHINGKNAWDIQLHDERFFSSVLIGGTLGFGESYVNKYWDCEKLDELFFRVFRMQSEQRFSYGLDEWRLELQSRLTNMQTAVRSKTVAEQHYDLGNSFYLAMLGPSMAYTCAYWAKADEQTTDTLDEAQKRKMDLICRKLSIQRGDKILDLGCGWGSFMKFAAENYGAQCVGYTISRQQAEYIEKLCHNLPITIRCADYRTLGNDEKFDRVVAIGLLEHVGYKNYRDFFSLIKKALKPDGISLVHSIGNNYSVPAIETWLHKYVFPNAVLPSAKQITAALEGLFIIEDWHNFGTHYDKTLMAWYQNFTTVINDVSKQHGERFVRLWTYYLLSCAGAMRARRTQLWQIVLSGRGLLGGYTSIR